MGKKASLFCNDQLSDGLRKFDKTALYSDVLSGKFRLMVAVDCGDLFRLGEFASAYDRCAETMTIDHHGGEFFSKYNCLAHYASTCR